MDKSNKRHVKVSRAASSDTVNKTIQRRSHPIKRSESEVQKSDRSKLSIHDSIKTDTTHDIYMQQYTADKVTFYVNLRTGDCIWEMPEDVPRTAVRYITHLTSSGHPYYENITTKQTSWSVPLNIMSTLARRRSAALRKMDFKQVNAYIESMSLLAKPNSPKRISDKESRTKALTRQRSESWQDGELITPERSTYRPRNRSLSCSDSPTSDSESPGDAIANSAQKHEERVKHAISEYRSHLLNLDSSSLAKTHRDKAKCILLSNHCPDLLERGKEIVGKWKHHLKPGDIFDIYHIRFSDWYTAEVISKHEEEYFVHYLTWSEEYDETIRLKDYDILPPYTVTSRPIVKRRPSEIIDPSHVASALEGENAVELQKQVAATKDTSPNKDTTEMYAIRIGIIGSGTECDMYCAAFTENPNFDIALVCAMNGDPIAMCEMYKVSTYTFDWCDLISSPDVDVVCLCTTDEDAEVIVTRVAQEGKPVYYHILRPPSVIDMANIVLELKELQAICMFGMDRRFDHCLRDFRQKVASGEVGMPLHLHIVSRHPGSLLQDGIHGGITHDIDVATYLLNSTVTEVFARRVIHVDSESLIVVLQLASGAVAVLDIFQNSCCQYDYHIGLSGSNGTMNYSSSSKEGESHSLLSMKELRKLQVAAFMDIIREGSPQIYLGQVAPNAVLLTTAVVLSIEKERPIRVDSIDSETGELLP